MYYPVTVVMSFEHGLGLIFDLRVLTEWIYNGTSSDEFNGPSKEYCFD